MSVLHVFEATSGCCWGRHNFVEASMLDLDSGSRLVGGFASGKENIDGHKRQSVDLLNAWNEILMLSEVSMMFVMLCGSRGEVWSDLPSVETDERSSPASLPWHENIDSSPGQR